MLIFRAWATCGRTFGDGQNRCCQKFEENRPNYGLFLRNRFAMVDLAQNAGFENLHKGFIPNYKGPEFNSTSYNMSRGR